MQTSSENHLDFGLLHDYFVLVQRLVNGQNAASRDTLLTTIFISTIY